MVQKKAEIKRNVVKKKSATMQRAASSPGKKTVIKRKRTQSEAPPAPPKVRVQMFRQGLGDSFLITFDHQGSNERRMLVDCGTLGNKTSTINTASISDYLKTFIANGHKIDVLVATHEHQDHVSGFRQDLQQVLSGNVNQVWLAWTEDPTNTVAKRIAKYKGDLGTALQQIAQLARNSTVGLNVSSLLGFVGDEALGANFASTVHAAMEFVRTGTGGKTVHLYPGNLIDNDVIPGFRIYVLGPPQNEASLKELGSHGSDELYSMAATLNHAAELHLKENIDFASDSALPFDQRYHEFGKQAMERQYPAYLTPESDWRRIDYDWLNGASELALQLDNLTNNTSLALAFERIADGKVLLFPADAQEGNWLSWHDPQMKWSFVDASSGAIRDVTTATLLAKTVFYKVGHHGSHNATAKGKGLELMTNQDELVAFIPVDRELALTRNPQGSWQMPARPLYKELLKRCQGRVARADTGWAAPPPTKDHPVEGVFFEMADKKQWEEWEKHQKAAKNVDVSNPLFIDYVLE